MRCLAFLVALAAMVVSSPVPAGEPAKKHRPRPLPIADAAPFDRADDAAAEKLDPPQVLKVYRTDDILPPLRDYPARRLDDLGDGRPLFGDVDLPQVPPSISVPIFGFGSGISGSMGGSVGGGECFPRPRLPRPGLPLPSKGELGDELIDIIEQSVAPGDWVGAGGDSSVVAIGQTLVVSTTQANHDEVRALFDALRAAAAARPMVTVEAHWLWLSEEELRGLVPAIADGKALAAKGLAVDEAAWQRLTERRKKDDGDAPPGFHAIVTCFNGQTASVSAGQQRRFIVTMVPVVGANGIMPPATPNTAAPTVTVPPPVDNSTRGVGYQASAVTLQEGAALQVRPMVAGDQVVLDVRSRVVEVTEVIPPDKAAQPRGAQAQAVHASAAAVDRPQVSTHRLETTLRAPAGQRVLAGGIGPAQDGDAMALYLFLKATPQAARK